MPKTSVSAPQTVKLEIRTQPNRVHFSFPNVPRHFSSVRAFFNTEVKNFSVVWVAAMFQFMSSVGRQFYQLGVSFFSEKRVRQCCRLFQVN